MTTTIPDAIETVTTSVVPSLISFVENTDAFKRIYKPSRAAWRAGERPLSMYFATEGIEMRRFGIEIEFNAEDELDISEDDGDCGCECECDDEEDEYCDYCENGCECESSGSQENSFSTWLHSKGYLPVSYGSAYHADAGRYGQWRYESDCTVTGGEVISPIMEGNGQSWADISTVMNGISALEGEADSKDCGGHISINAPELNEGMATVGSRFHRMLILVTKFEDVMYRLATNPYRVLEEGGASTHRGTSFASSLHPGAFIAFPERSSYLLCGHDWLNFTRQGGRLEFRIFDGTLDPALAQTWALIANAFVNAASRDDIDEALEAMPQRLLGHHINERRTAGAQARTALTGEAWEKDTEAIRQFVDLLFTRTEDKERVITLFAANDWNYDQEETNRRYRNRMCRR